MASPGRGPGKEPRQARALVLLSCSCSSSVIYTVLNQIPTLTATAMTMSTATTATPNHAKHNKNSRNEASEQPATSTGCEFHLQEEPRMPLFWLSISNPGTRTVCTSIGSIPRSSRTKAMLAAEAKYISFPTFPMTWEFEQVLR